MRTVLITGASAGIGAATARRFAAAGDTLILVARREEKMRALGLPGQLIALDVRDREGVAKALSGLEVDVLVNNAGMAAGLAPAQNADLAGWEQTVDTNIKGLLYVTHALLPSMAQRKRGHVINLGSAAGTFPYPGGNVYGATKAFVELFSLNLRADLLGAGVRVTNIEPGMVETDFSVVRFGGDEAKARAVYAGMQPLTADDVADTIFWAATRPAHVNINRIELMPIDQANGPFAVKRS
jgi:3-hydroxy acid dehydrogenase/malonic semialdehyde reductase